MVMSLGACDRRLASPFGTAILLGKLGGLAENDLAKMAAGAVAGGDKEGRVGQNYRYSNSLENFVSSMESIGFATSALVADW